MTDTPQNMLHEWLLELGAIDNELEQSAAAILEACEALMSEKGSDSEVANYAGQIMEHCAFHDLNSQRLRKIIKGLSHSMFNGAAQENVSEHASQKNDPLMNGPQRQDQALSQKEVEEVFSKSHT